jgi:hypothetical protein
MVEYTNVYDACLSLCSLLSLCVVLAVTNRNANASMVLMFLYRIVEVGIDNLV